MIESLNIGSTIFDKLDTISALNHQIYPLIAENNTTFPFVIYTRNGLTGLLCKDGLYQDEINMSIQVITDNYSDGITLAQEVREKLTFKTHTMESHLTGAHEEYANDAYIQTLDFQISMNN